jgi:hypothetical protein
MAMSAFRPATNVHAGKPEKVYSLFILISFE